MNLDFFSIGLINIYLNNLYKVYNYYIQLNKANLE